jgi:hypothetical protein
VRLLPADAVETVIFEVAYQPGAGSQPWALQCRHEHEISFLQQRAWLPRAAAAFGSVDREAGEMLTQTQDEEQIIARVAACDIGKAELVCCVRVPDEDRPGRRHRRCRRMPR